MDLLRAKTVATLAQVLRLCEVTQDDVDALQRHDDAALATLDVNDADAMKALKPWIKCLEAWRDAAASRNSEGPWSAITQPCSVVLSSAINDENSPSLISSEHHPQLAAHKALAVILHRTMLLGDEIQGSPHRAPAPAAWAAGRAYLLALSLPGAGAYGILSPAVVGAVLTNIRSWCRNSPVHRSGGAVAGGVSNSAGGGKGKGKGAKKRGRENADAESDGESSDEDQSGVVQGGARKARLAVGGADRGFVPEVQACVGLLKACLASVPLGSHQDLAVKLSEVLVGVSVVAAVDGGASSLADTVSVALVELELATSEGRGGGGAARGAVIRALMPVILMASGKADVPKRAKDCFKAHDHAIQIAKAIAVALRKASSGTSSKQRRLARDQEDHPTSPSLQDAREGSQQRSPGIDANNIPGDIGENTSPLAALEIARKPGEAGSSLGKSASDSDEPSPVLFMVARLCASAPDRAEGRAKLAGGIAALLPELGAYDRGRFISFLAKFSRNSRISHRGFAVELSSRLIAEAWPWAAASDSTSGNEQPALEGSGVASEDPTPNQPSSMDAGGKTMLDLVVARAWDRAPTVRSKAVSTLSEVLEGIRKMPAGGVAGEPLRLAVMESCGWGGTEDKSPPREGPLLEVIRTRVQDEKANVRRNAVPALEALLSLSPAFGGRCFGGIDDRSDKSEEGLIVDPVAEHAGDLMLVEERCNDVSVSTRKAAMTAVSSLLMSRPGDDRLQSAWVRAVMPLASDPEQSCQNRLVELVRTVLLDRVVEWYRREAQAGAESDRRKKSRGATGAVAAHTDEVSSVWPLLSKAGDGEAHKCLKKVVSVLVSQKEPGFNVRPLLKALRSAAVMALPPKAAIAAAAEDEDTEGEAEDTGEWTNGDLRLLSLGEKLPRSFLAVIRRGTWALLEAFLERSAKAMHTQDGEGKTSSSLDMDPMFVVRCWNRTRGHILARAAYKGEDPPSNDSCGEEFESEEAFESDGRRVLGVLARLASLVPSEVATPLAERLLEMLLDLVARPETSAALVKALHMLCFAKAESEAAGAVMCNAWANHALHCFEGLLDVFIYRGSGALQEHAGARACGFDMAKLIERLLFAIGEVASVGFSPKEDAAGPSDLQAPGASAAESVMVRPSPSARLVKLVQVLLPPRLPQSANGLDQPTGEGPATPRAVRALAFVTLGHLCMRDKGLAKTSVNILVRELDTADDPAVRSNALVVLGDLCVRYTAMVDRHVGAMAACLQDPHPLVRRHAILLISQLLLQDYVKWRGLLLYRFLATLVDSDASVRSLGVFTLTRPLITKTPGLFAQNFVEALFVLNNYSEHPCYMAAAAGRADVGGGVTMEGIDLGGDDPEQVRKRMSVYWTMLEHMSAENKITVTAKLAQEVLSAAVEGGLPIASNTKTDKRLAVPGNGMGEGKEFEVHRKASTVVKDALTVMASPAIRVGKGTGASEDLDDGSEEPGSQQSSASGLAAAKSKLLSKVALKHLMETVVPILTALKHVLERDHSPILRELMSYFGEILRSHKDEVRAVLASEPGLVEEVEFDLRRFEKEEQEQKKAKEAYVAAAAAAAAVSASTPSMGPPRTPRRRRSSGAGGGVASGRRDSSAGPSSRGPFTPMAAVIKSARKTPFQNLADCSGIRLKGSTAPTAMAISPPLARGVGGGNGTGTATRGPRPKTPLKLRTPREAVAAALGNSPMAVSPLPMRSVLGDEENHVPGASESKASVDANIKLDSPEMAVSCPLEERKPLNMELPVEHPVRRRSARRGQDKASKNGTVGTSRGRRTDSTAVASTEAAGSTSRNKAGKSSQPSSKPLRRSGRV